MCLHVEICYFWYIGMKKYFVSIIENVKYAKKNSYRKY